VGSRAELTTTWRHALAWRAERQLLEPRSEATPADVVRRLGAVLSMDETLAELAVRTRSASAAAGDLARALVAGEVVQVFAFRGSMHHVAPEDGGVYLALRAAGRQWELPSWVEHYGLRPEEWPAFRATVRDALTDAPLTVRELGAAVTRYAAYRHLREVFEDGAGTLVKPLTWQGDVSLGPRREGRQTLQRLDTQPRWGGVPDLEDAGPRAVEAYLRSYGPATHDHVHRWLGAGLSAGRRRIDRWLAGLGDRLVAADVEGTTAYVVVDDADALARATPSGAVRFLPGHDQWVMGPGTQDVHVVPPGCRDAVTRKANPVLHDGVVRGTWTARRGLLSVTWLEPGPVPRAALESEAARTAALLGGELDLDLPA
jgi:hypothetical protein